MVWLNQSAYYHPASETPFEWRFAGGRQWTFLRVIWHMHLAVYGAMEDIIQYSVLCEALKHFIIL